MNGKEWTIRRFDPRFDLDQVVSLNRIFLPENYHRSFFLENFRRWPDGFWVAEIDGRVVGYIMCRVEPKYTRRETLMAGHVLSIAVHRGYRRRGIGTSLMKRAEEGLLRSGGIDLMFLEVRISNAPAIKMYRKMGYEVLGTIPGYYSDGEDAYLMYKLLSEGVSRGAVEEAFAGRVRKGILHSHPG